MDTKPLSRRFNVAVHHIAGLVLPRGFDVSADAPATYGQLAEHFWHTGRICVWNGASDQTIFADPETNLAFRAWHDARHLTTQAQFDRAGELKVCAAQIADVCAVYDGRNANLFAEILRAEIVGQFDYRAIHGGFPADQIGFARAYIANVWGYSLSPLYGRARFGISR